MDCKRVEEELVSFHLAVLDGATRAAVEAHLCGCAHCVGAYLMLKRAVDAGEDAPAPSELARARVLAAARQQLQAPAAARPRRRIWSWAAVAAALLLAPVAYRAGMYQGATQSATTVATPALPPLDVRPVSTRPAGSGAIDTARTTAENLQFL